ncbi:hypothetical protein BKA01_001555 [Pseudonocardia eucalypti]|nr:hypothetical protein [Pseudonocardia eucalypti]
MIAALFALTTWNRASGYMLNQRELSASRQAACWSL